MFYKFLNSFLSSGLSMEPFIDKLIGLVLSRFIASIIVLKMAAPAIRYFLTISTNIDKRVIKKWAGFPGFLCLNFPF